MNILVTGAAGYIGSICSEVLLARGYQVVALDNLQEGHRAAVPPGAIFCRVDLGVRAQIEEVFSKHKIDAVMHFAGEALVAKSVREPSTFYAANIACGVNLLDAMIRHGKVKSSFFLPPPPLTASLTPSPSPKTIPRIPLIPTANPSSASRKSFPTIAPTPVSYFATLRYFNAAGASAERGEAHRVETHLIPSVLDAALGMIPHLEVFGSDYPTPDGTCVRDYIHVLDIADSHVRALESIEKVSGEAFNVGNSRGFSILEVLDATERITGRKIPRKLSPRRPGDPAVLVASKDKLHRVLGWEAQHSSLEEIITSAWSWKQKHPHG